MAAFTTFDEAALVRYLQMFGVGDLTRFEPIEQGIENSNYFVTVTQHEEERELVLTILENHSFDEVPFFSSLLTHLSHFGLPVPRPRPTLDGMTMTIFCGKPAMLVPRLEGSHLTAVSSEHCFRVGQLMAEIHRTLTGQPWSRQNPYNSEWMFSSIASLESLEDNRRQQLIQVAEQYEALEELSLPRGVIHGDLFTDNALFSGEEITGIIDFYHACDDFLVQDIAITINDWCKDGNGGVSTALVDKVIEGYESVRPLEAEERELLNNFQQIGAARFALTRFFSGDESGHLKDPVEFLALLDTLLASADQ